MQCDHLTNFALVMTEGTSSGGRLAGRGGQTGGFGQPGGRSGSGSSGQPSPAQPVTVSERAFLSKNVSTIVAAVATLISFAVICFFAYMAVKKMKVSSQCRSALGKSGVLCFHKGKVSHSDV